MNNKGEIIKELFHYPKDGNGNIQDAVYVGRSLLQSGPSNQKSQTLTPKGNSAKPKLNVVVYLFDQLKKVGGKNGDETFYFKPSTKQLYAELHEENKCLVYSDGENIICKFLADTEYPWGKHTYDPLLMFIIASKICPEISETFEEEMKSPTDIIYRFCDTFYRFISNNVNNLIITTGFEEEFQAYFRSGDYNLLDLPHCEELKHSKMEKYDPSKEFKEIPEQKGDTRTLAQKAKDGEYLIEKLFPMIKAMIPKEMHDMIPPLSTLANYKFTKEFWGCHEEIMEGLKGAYENLKTGNTTPDSRFVANICLYGPPGTGKTAMCKALAAVYGLPFGYECFSKDTDKEVQEGRSTVTKGVFDTLHTDLMKIHKNGGIILCDEFNLACENAQQAIFGASCESPYEIKFEGVEPIIRSPFCIYMTACNIGVAGTYGLHAATLTRFEYKCEITDPGHQEAVQRLVSMSGASEDICDKVITYYNKLKKTVSSADYQAEEIADFLSLRGCKKMAQLVQRGHSYEDAAKHTLLPNIKMNDSEIWERITGDVKVPA